MHSCLRKQFASEAYVASVMIRNYEWIATSHLGARAPGRRS